MFTCSTIKNKVQLDFVFFEILKHILPINTHFSAKLVTVPGMSQVEDMVNAPHFSAKQVPAPGRTVKWRT